MNHQFRSQFKETEQEKHVFVYGRHKLNECIKIIKKELNNKIHSHSNTELYAIDIWSNLFIKIIGVQVYEVVYTTSIYN